MSSPQTDHHTDQISVHGFAKPTILIVDDIEINRMVLDQCLRSFNCNLEIATNGEEAVSIFSACKPDLVLLDIMMPIMNGFDAAKNIRALEKNAGAILTPIIAITAHVRPRDQHICIAAGMNDYMSKPVRRDELIAKVQTWAPHIIDPADQLPASA